MGSASSGACKGPSAGIGRADGMTNFQRGVKVRTKASLVLEPMDDFNLDCIHHWACELATRRKAANFDTF